MTKRFSRSKFPSLKKILIPKEFSIVENYFLFSFIIIAFTITIYLFFSQKIYSENSVAVLEKQSLRIEKSLVDNIEYTAYLMNYMGYQIKNHDYKNLNYIETLLSSFRLNSDLNEKTPWNMFSWIDENDQLVVNSNMGLVTPSINVADRDYLEPCKKNPEKLELGKVTIGKVSREIIIPAAMSVYKDEKYLGTIVFGLQIKKLSEKLMQATNSEGITFAIFDEQKNIILKSNNFVTSNSLIKEMEKIPATKNGGEIGHFSTFGKNSDFGYFQKLEKYSYILVIQYEEGFLKKDLKTKIFPYFLGVLLILTILGFILLLLRIIIINPILSLSKVAKSISEGHLHVKISHSNITEINRLSKSLAMIQDFVRKEQESKLQLDVARQTAEKANLSRATILRSITHDIKNYIFGIFGLTRLILEKKDKAEISKNEDLQTIETISDQSQELMHFVEDLLDTNQVEHGKFTLGKIEDCNLKSLIDRMLLLNHGLAIRHHVTLKTEIDNDLPPLRCDARRIKQVLSNLITNAIKYSHTESEVKITAKYLAEKHQIYLEIADNGIGLSDGEIKMIFEGAGGKINKSALKKEIDSNGIGMTIVLALLKLHHAKIDIDSSKGFGTKIKLYFNLDFQAEEAENHVKLLRKNKADVTILLVEDNPVNIKVTTTILRNSGYKTYYAENGKEALKILDEKHFDLILMDGEMPVMNGYETTKAIRSGKIFTNFDNFKNIPIIALMSSSDPETLKRAKESGMDDHLEKSSSKNKLLTTIESYLLKKASRSKKKV